MMCTRSQRGRSDVAGVCFAACVRAVLSSWVDSVKGVAADPLSVGFPTIVNDKSGARSYPKGANEVSARTIKPKVKNFDPKLRVTGIPGFNAFGSPSSKQAPIEKKDLFLGLF